MTQGNNTVDVISNDARILLISTRINPNTPNFLRRVGSGGRYRCTIPVDTFTPAMGIRIIAENYKGIDVLEYPSIQEYERELSKGFDIVGISFLTCQVEEAKRMVELARSYGVKEVWGGGWGIDTPQVRDWFDRSFSGHGEQLLLPILGSRWKGHLRHPILIGPAEFFKVKTKVGYLYSIRGCKYKCTYCPTPAVIPTRVIMPQKEIESVLDAYAKEKVGAVVIYDETFLSDQPYSWQIVDMLDERGLPWFCLTSSVELNGNVSKLRDKGFLGCLMGIESLRDKTLVDYKRGRLTDLNLKVIKEMKENSCYLIGTYIFCHETDTKQSMRSDIDKLSSLDIPFVMPCILTPFPPTPVFEQFRSRIIDWNWKHWDDGHLVWRHPHVTPEEAREILFECADNCNRLRYNLEFITKEAICRMIPFKLKRTLFKKSISRSRPSDLVISEPPMRQYQTDTDNKNT
jgi:hypothetical protein